MFIFFKVKENENATDIDIKTNGTVLGLKSKPYYIISYIMIHNLIDITPYDMAILYGSYHLTHMIWAVC